MAERVKVAAIKPFWRWAVRPVNLSPDLLAHPFYRRRAAEALARDHQRRMGDVHAPCLLYRKTWFTRRVELVGEVS